MPNSGSADTSKNTGRRPPPPIPPKGIGHDRERKRAKIKGVFVQRPATDHLAALFDKVRADRDGVPEPSCILLTGDTGTGKTSFLKNYVDRFPPRRESGRLIQPVVRVEFTTGATANAAASVLLTGLNDPSGGAGKLADLIARIVDQTPKQAVELYIIDEGQHLIETGLKRINRAGDLIKQVSKKTNVPFVMAGMTSLSTIIDSNPQLAGITPYRYELGMFTYGSDQDRKIFRTFLALVDAALPFDHLAGLADPEPSLRLFNASGGRMRLLMTLLRQAALHAVDRGATQMSAEDLHYGFDQTPGVDRDNNPFDLLA